MSELAVQSFDVSGEAWEVLDISRGINGRMSEVRVRVTLPVAIEDWSTEFTPADRLYVRRDPAGTPEVVCKVRALTPNISWSAQDESMVATLVGPEWDLRRHTIFGQRHREAADADATTPEYLTGLKCVFNPDGLPNKGALGGSGADQHLFHPDPTQTGGGAPDSWTVKDAVEYVVQSYQAWCTAEAESPVITDGSITWPDSGGYEDIEVYHLRVHGLAVDQALTEILSRHGLSWTLVPIDAADETHTLYIFAMGDETAAAAEDKLSVYLPEHDGSLPGGGANEDKAVTAGHLIFDHVPVVTRVLGYSGVQVYEDTFELIPGWSAAAEIYARGGAGVTDVWRQIGYLERNIHPDTSSDWEQCKHVFRRWILNETGRELNRDAETDPYDFSTLFGNTKYAKRRRPFLPHRMTRDDEGRYLPVKILVESPIHAYQHAAQYEWELLSDVAGVLFTGPTPPTFFLRALLSDDMDHALPYNVWAVAAVESDSCYLHESEPASPALSITVDQALDLEGKLFWDNINGSALESAFGDYVDAKAEVWKQRLDSGQVVIDKVAPSYRPGQWITSIDGRTMTVHAQIVEVRWDVEYQRTHLALSTLAVDLDSPPLKPDPTPEEEPIVPERGGYWSRNTPGGQP